jgi:ATP-binding cassette subfamily B protein/subfamily B ATP-binding cassette protein MsbA
MKSMAFALQYVRKYTRPLAITVLSMAGLVAISLVTPAVVRDLIASLRSDIDLGSGLANVTRLALLLLALYIVRAGLRLAASYMAHIAGWGVVADSRNAIYRHLQRLSLGFYSEQQTGDLMSRMVNDSDMFERLISHAIPDTLVNVLSLIGVSIMLLRMNTTLMLLTLIPVPFIILAMRGYAKIVRPAFVARQQKLGELNATLADNLSGIREIKAFTHEEHESSRIAIYISNYRDSLLRALRLMATFNSVTEFASSLGTIIIVYFGGRLAFGGALQIEDLVAFFMYLEMFYGPVRALTGAWEQIQEALAGAKRVGELLQEPPEVTDKPDAITLPQPVRGDIVLDNVSFSYARSEPVLEGISLTIPAGTVTALVGPTGVGKTTLASLIPRFYDVTGGAITLDGHDLRDIQLQSLRAQVSIVLQDVFLFHGTVRDNILFGRANASEEEMIAAARIANAEEFIERLPQDYDTLIGERGVKLSGGQKQRLSIARAVLKNAPILILDEATSSVDTETEVLIQQALDRLIRGRTTIIIVHRLSTIRNADKIVVLEGRQIAEQGTHAELMARDGIYHRLNEVQNRLEVKQGLMA